MCREDPALKVSHMQQSSLWQPDICIYQDQLLCAATMPDKIGGAGGVQTQACGAAAAALASMGSCQTQSAAAWNNGAQGTSGLHHAACLEALAMAGQQQGTAHQSTAPRYQCGTQRSTSACTYARFQGCSNVQHHCSQPEAITIGGQLDDTIAYTGMLCLLHDNTIAYTGMLCLVHDDTIAYIDMLFLLHDDTIACIGMLCLLQTTNGCLCRCHACSEFAIMLGSLCCRLSWSESLSIASIAGSCMTQGVRSMSSWWPACTAGRTGQGTSETNEHGCSRRTVQMHSGMCCRQCQPCMCLLCSH